MYFNTNKNRFYWFRSEKKIGNTNWLFYLTLYWFYKGVYIFLNVSDENISVLSKTKSEKQTLKSNNVIMFLNKRDLRELREREKNEKCKHDFLKKNRKFNPFQSCLNLKIRG